MNVVILYFGVSHIFFLCAGLIDEDNHQVFDCSSLENTETENEYSDFDDPMDFETDELNELTKKNSDSCSRGDVPKDPKSSYKKDLDENGIHSVLFIQIINTLRV